MNNYYKPFVFPNIQKLNFVVDILILLHYKTAIPQITTNTIFQIRERQSEELKLINISPLCQYCLSLRLTGIVSRHSLIVTHLL